MTPDTGAPTSYRALLAGAVPLRDPAKMAMLKPTPMNYTPDLSHLHTCTSCANAAAAHAAAAEAAAVLDGRWPQRGAQARTGVRGIKWHILHAECVRRIRHGEQPAGAAPALLSCGKDGCVRGWKWDVDSGQLVHGAHTTSSATVSSASMTSASDKPSAGPVTGPSGASIPCGRGTIIITYTPLPYIVQDSSYHLFRSLVGRGREHILRGLGHIGVCLTLPNVSASAPVAQRD